MASAMKQAPTILMLSLSLLSRRYSSASTDILQRSGAPDVSSMTLTIPNPTREMLPAIPPATTATRPSRLFHAIVKYSNRIPRLAILSRVVANSITARAYQGAQGTCRRAIAKCMLWMKARDEAHLPSQSETKKAWVVNTAAVIRRHGCRREKTGGSDGNRTRGLLRDRRSNQL